MNEGYVKFTSLHQPGALPRHPDLGELDDLRTCLFDLGILGTSPDGTSFGNVSCRAPGGRPQAFIVTATRTGGIRRLGPQGYCLVTGTDFAANTVSSIGAQPPSSEALSHAAVYLASPAVFCAAHIHSSILFRTLARSGFPATSPTAAFGTPDMALEAARLVRLNPGQGGLVMSGHRDGLLFYNATISALRNFIVQIMMNTAER